MSSVRDMRGVCIEMDLQLGKEKRRIKGQMWEHRGRGGREEGKQREKSKRRSLQGTWKSLRK